MTGKMKPTAFRNGSNNEEGASGGVPDVFLCVVDIRLYGGDVLHRTRSSILIGSQLPVVMVSGSNSTHSRWLQAIRDKVHRER